MLWKCISFALKIFGNMVQGGVRNAEVENVHVQEEVGEPWWAAWEGAVVEPWMVTVCMEEFLEM